MTNSEIQKSGMKRHKLGIGTNHQSTILDFSPEEITIPTQNSTTTVQDTTHQDSEYLSKREKIFFLFLFYFIFKYNVLIK
jgi:hypothetical protein